MTGVVTEIIDCGSIVQVFIRTYEHDCDTEGIRGVYAADGNMWRRGPAFDINVGDTVEFEGNDWGGLEWIAPVEEGCPCGGHGLDCARG